LHELHGLVYFFEAYVREKDDIDVIKDFKDLEEQNFTIAI